MPLHVWEKRQCMKKFRINRKVGKCWTPARIRQNNWNGLRETRKLRIIPPYAIKANKWNVPVAPKVEKTGGTGSRINRVLWANGAN